MSPNPRGLTNTSANNLIFGDFPEQGNELVGIIVFIFSFFFWGGGGLKIVLLRVWRFWACPGWHFFAFASSSSSFSRCVQVSLSSKDPALPSPYSQIDGNSLKTCLFTCWFILVQWRLSIPKFPFKVSQSFVCSRMSVLLFQNIAVLSSRWNYHVHRVHCDHDDNSDDYCDDNSDDDDDDDD